MQEPVAFKEETKDFQLPVVIKATPFVLPEQALSEVEAPVQEEDAQLKKTLKNQTLKNMKKRKRKARKESRQRK